MDIVIDELIIEEDRVEHIAKHGVTIDEVFEVVGSPAVSAILEGYNACILAFGQTASGKTENVRSGGATFFLFRFAVFRLFGSWVLPFGICAFFGFRYSCFEFAVRSSSAPFFHTPSRAPSF